MASFTLKTAVAWDGSVRIGTALEGDAAVAVVVETEAVAEGVVVLEVAEADVCGCVARE